MKKMTILLMAMLVLSAGVAQASISIYGSPTGYQSNDKDWMSNTTDDIDGNGLGTDGYIFFGNFNPPNNNTTWTGGGEISAIQSTLVTHSYPSYISTATMGANCNSKVGRYTHYEVIDDPLIGDGTDNPCGNIIILQNTAGEALNFTVSGLGAGTTVRVGVVTVLNDDARARWDIPTIALTDGTDTVSVTDLPNLSHGDDTTGPGWVFFDIDSDGDYTLLLPPDAAGTDPDHTGLGGVTFDSGSLGAHTPTPANGITILASDVLSTPDPSWLSPLQDADGNPVTDSNIVSVDGYDVWWSVAEEPNYVIDTPYANGTSKIFDLSAAGQAAIDYATTYYWRVDTRVTVDSNEITGTASVEMTIQGSPWSFTTEPAYTLPVIENFNNVISTLDIGSGDLSATVTGNSDAITSVVWTPLTDDVDFPAGSDVAVLNTTTDNQNPTATLTTTDAGTYKVKLTVSDGKTILEAIVEVAMYADACQAQKDAPSAWVQNSYDFDGNCLVDLLDFAMVAAEWLDDTSLDSQETFSGSGNYLPKAIYDNRIEAEWVDPNDPNACSDGPISDTVGIRIQDQPNASGGAALGYASAGAWVEYTIDVPVSAVGVPVDLYVAHALNGTGTVTVSLGDADVPDAFQFTVNGTGSWTNFTDGSKIGVVMFSAAGEQVYRVTFGGGLNLDWFSFDW